MIQINKKSASFNAMRLLCELPVNKDKRQHKSDIRIGSCGLAASNNGHCMAVVDLSGLNLVSGWYKIAKNNASEVILVRSDNDQEYQGPYDDQFLSKMDTGQAMINYTHEYCERKGEAESLLMFELSRRSVCVNIKYIEIALKHFSCPDIYVKDHISPVLLRENNMLFIIMPIKTN